MNFKFFRLMIMTLLTAMAGLVTTPMFAAPVSAFSADTFVDSIGVCTHWQYADTVYGRQFPELQARLLEAGIRHVRDGGANGTFISNTRKLAASGVRTTIMVDPGSGIVPDEKYWTPSSSPRYLPGNFVKNVLGTNAVSGVEVLNEIDLFFARDGFVHDFAQAGLFWAAGSSKSTCRPVTTAPSMCAICCSKSVTARSGWCFTMRLPTAPAPLLTARISTAQPVN